MAADFNDVFVFDLPDDPEEAFLVFERDRWAELENEKSQSHWGAEETYIEAMLAFTELVDFPLAPQIDPLPLEYTDFGGYFSLQRSKIRTAILKIKLKRSFAAKQVKDRVIVLTDETKTAIRQLVEAIRAKIADLPLTPDKSRALIAKLHAFSLELDQELTRTEAFFSFAANVGRALKDIGAEFKPLGDRIDRILDLIEKAEKLADRLPNMNRKNQELPAPPKQLENKGAPSDNDQDIPF